MSLWCGSFCDLEVIKKLIPNFRFKSHSYARPNRPWVCGHRDQPCEFGPSSKGVCEVSYECRPMKNGDRWVCNRGRKGSDKCPCEVGPSSTGVCGQPIRKCSPRASLSLLLQRTTLAVIGVVVTGLLLSFSSNRGSGVVSPGALTRAHSGGETDCQICHLGVGRGDAIDWFSKGSDQPHAGMSQLTCTKCHDLGIDPLNPHSMGDRDLVALAALAKAEVDLLDDAIDVGLPVELLRAAFGGWAPDKGTFQVDCGRCHKEHQGKFHDLKQMSTTQCQVCHESAFKSFEEGHPPFGNYPFSNRSRIIFNHDSHFNQHFEASPEMAMGPQSCLSCHYVDDEGSHVYVKSFSQACASCHEEEIVPRSFAGGKLPVLRIPLVDVEAFEDGGEPVGEWPDDWDSLETTLPPITMMLLAATEQADLIEQFWDADLDVIEEDQIKGSSELLWAVKRLLMGVRENGVSELSERLERSLGRTLTKVERTTFENSFPAEAVGEMIDAWIPNAQAEMKAREAGDSPEAQFMEGMEDRLSFDPFELARGWVRSDTDLTLYYQPTRHGDPLMKLMLDAALKSDVVGEQMFDGISGNSDRPQPGRCMKCHNVKPFPELGVHWQSIQFPRELRSFTKFSHSAHFGSIDMLSSKGCYSCHALKATEDDRRYLQSFRYFNPTSTGDYTGSFDRIELKTCSNCHIERLAGNSCLTCHNYHVGEFEEITRSSSLMESMTLQSK
jgi:hypothetical protein